MLPWEWTSQLCSSQLRDFELVNKERCSHVHLKNIASTLRFALKVNGIPVSTAGCDNTTDGRSNRQSHLLQYQSFGIRNT